MGKRKYFFILLFFTLVHAGRIFNPKQTLQELYTNFLQIRTLLLNQDFFPEKYVMKAKKEFFDINIFFIKNEEQLKVGSEESFFLKVKKELDECGKQVYVASGNMDFWEKILDDLLLQLECLEE